jgi:cardiolipin synthase (CMP-forming)
LTVCARDLFIASGAVLWRLFVGRIYPQPSFLSKACTFTQIAYLVCVLLALAHWPVFPSSLLVWPVAVLCVASGLDYAVRWSHRAWLARHAS